MTRSSNAVRFGLNPRNLPYERVVEVAKAAEAAGFQNISFSDRPPENNLEGWTLATAVAIQTSRIRVTHSTLNVPFRNPALLSKMATALDFITGGDRVILTLGAGTQADHFTTYGIGFHSAGERVEGLIDAIEILRGTWANEQFSYEGKQYHAAGATVTPKPVNGTIPIFIGAAQPRMMRLTGRTADGWIRNGGWPSDLDAYRAQLRYAGRSGGGSGPRWHEDPPGGELQRLRRQRRPRDETGIDVRQSRRTDGDAGAGAGNDSSLPRGRRGHVPRAVPERHHR